MNLYEKINSYTFADFDGRIEDFNECYGTDIDVIKTLKSKNIDQDNAIIEFLKFCESAILLFSLLNSAEFEFHGEVDHAVDSLSGYVFDMMDNKFYELMMTI
jgi:hypothetical protein